MTTATTAISRLEAAIDQVGTIVAAVTPEQLGGPTPCASWNLADLIGHVLHDLRQFHLMAEGGKWAGGEATDIGAEWAATFARDSQRLIDTWRKLTQGEDDQGTAARVDQQITEFAVHGWDIAVAAGQKHRLDDAIATASLTWGQANLKPEFRGSEASGKVFGVEVDVAAAAPAYDRLAGFFGRDPAWSPG